MGYMCHHAILITTYDEHHATRAHDRAETIFEDTLVSPVQESVINGYYSFAIFPDGSKEGWSASDKGDEHRTMFIAWLEKQRNEDRSSWYDWVEVQYGDDDLATRIVNDSDALIREKGYLED